MRLHQQHTEKTPNSNGSCLPSKPMMNTGGEPLLFSVSTRGMMAKFNRRWLLTLLAICLFLTLLSGISFAAGSRSRAPLELIGPLLAAIGLVKGIRAITFAVRLRMA